MIAAHDTIKFTPPEQENEAVLNMVQPEINIYDNNLQQPLLYDQQSMVQRQTQIIIDPPPIFIFQPKMTGFQKLQNMSGIFIKQKFDKLNAMCGWDQKHKYFIYGLDNDGKQKKDSKMFKCYEKSECLQRQLCSPHCRAFIMEVKHKDYQDNNFDASNFLLFERDFKCTCLCIERPELKVHSTEGGAAVYLGKIKNPFRFCSLTCEIYDSQNLLRYQIVGSLCQCGVLCEGSLCQSSSLNIKDNQGNLCGTLKRIHGNVLHNCVTTQANFAVTFPSQSTPAERALLIGATIMIDFTYFEKTCQCGARKI